MATSYSNPGGSGTRSGGDIIAFYGGTGANGLPVYTLVDDATVLTIDNTPPPYTPTFTYAFGSPRIIDQMRLNYTGTAPSFTWFVEGSNTSFDGPWVSIPTSTVTAGGISTVSCPNVIPYKYYRLHCNQGAQTASYSLRLVEFRIDDFADGWYDTYSTGNRASIITVANTAGTSANLMDNTSYVQWSTVYFVASQDPRFTLTAAKPLTGIRMTCQTASNVGNYIVDGSTDGTNWVPLSATTTISFTRPTISTATDGYMYDVRFDNETEYRFYRLRRTGSNVGGQFLGVLALKIGHQIRPIPPESSRRRMPYIVN